MSTVLRSTSLEADAVGVGRDRLTTGAAFLAFDRAVGRASSACAQALLAAGAVLGFYQVLTRFLFQAPSDWTEVLTRTVLVWMVYIGLGVAFREGSMISIELLRSRLGGRAGWWLRAAISAAGVALMLMVAWYGAQVAWAVRFQTLAGLDVSISWAYLAVPVGAVLAISGIVANFLHPVNRELDNAV